MDHMIKVSFEGLNRERGVEMGMGHSMAPAMTWQTTRPTTWLTMPSTQCGIMLVMMALVSRQDVMKIGMPRTSIW